MTACVYLIPLNFSGLLDLLLIPFFCNYVFLIAATLAVSDTMNLTVLFYEGF